MTGRLAGPTPPWWCGFAPPRRGAPAASRSGRCLAAGPWIAAMEDRVERETYRKVRWSVLGISLAVCLLAYAHLIPIVFGMAASCAIPLVWAVDAYRAERRLMFALAATLLLVTALPLLHLAR